MVRTRYCDSFKLVSFLIDIKKNPLKYKKEDFFYLKQKKMSKLTEHFSVKEMLHSSYAKKNGIRNVPNTDDYYRVLFNLGRLCSILLEPIRMLLGKPIFINSGFRNAELNKAVGGVHNSRHLTGCAADISLKNISSSDIQKLKAWQSMNPDVKEFIVRQTYLHIAIDELNL